MTRQERVDEANRLLATGKHMDLKKAKKILKELDKEQKLVGTTDQIKLF
ncbi:hypothetical protein [Spirosoma aerolatum]|nr:hypothetical protein [Spirosoma aerolatum]